MKLGIIKVVADSGVDETKNTRVIAEPLGVEHYHEIEARLGYTFVEKAWLERALTHRSVHARGAKSDYENHRLPIERKAEA